MSSKELKEEKCDNFTCVPYVEIVSTMLIVAMLCGTIIRVYQMLITQRQNELVFLRGSHRI